MISNGSYEPQKITDLTNHQLFSGLKQTWNQKYLISFHAGRKIYLHDGKRIQEIVH